LPPAVREGLLWLDIGRGNEGALLVKSQMTRANWSASR